MNSSPMHRRLLLLVALILAVTLVGLVVLWPGSPGTAAGEAPTDDVVAAEVLEVVRGEPDAGAADEPGVPSDSGAVGDSLTGTSAGLLTVTLELLDGPDAGDVVELDVNPEGYPDFAVGDRVVLSPTAIPEGGTTYFITDFQRLPTLALLVGLFVGAVLVIGRWHGLRSLVGLGLSLFIVVRFVVPGILVGQYPPLVALVGALAVMIVTLYVTHGVNEMTTAAVVGTAGALVLTVALGSVFIARSKITGFASDDAVFARFVVEGLDLQGLVLAGLIIAALGVLDDVTISQASTVFALHETDTQLSWTALFRRAMKVGRDHIASVVNTLFLAYAGASLALLVLFSTGGTSVASILNAEVLAEEIIKTVVGSLGLIAAVPLTTALATTVAVRSR